MRREGRIHGYEFERDSRRRVKAAGKPTNRSKIRRPSRINMNQRKAVEERVISPSAMAMVVKGSKSLKKSKGQRNKALAAAAAGCDWTLRRRRLDLTTVNLGLDIDLEPSSDDDHGDDDNEQHHHPFSISAFTPPSLYIVGQVRAGSASGSDAEIGCECYHESDEEEDGDWLDLGDERGAVVDDTNNATDASSEEWFLC